MHQLNRLPLAIGVLAAFALTSCQVYDKEYKALAAVADTAPNPDAIVGMWHRRVNDLEWRWRMNLLFAKDGTGAAESFFSDSGIMGGERAQFDDMDRFKWSYQGGGVWAMESLGAPGRSDTCRISRGKLLRIRGGSSDGGTWYYVYEKVRL